MLTPFPVRGKARPYLRYALRLKNGQWFVLDRVSLHLTPCETRQIAFDYAACLNVIVLGMRRV